MSKAPLYCDKLKTAGTETTVLVINIFGYFFVASLLLAGRPVTGKISRTWTEHGRKAKTVLRIQLPTSKALLPLPPASLWHCIGSQESFFKATTVGPKKVCGVSPPFAHSYTGVVLTSFLKTVRQVTHICSSALFKLVHSVVWAECYINLNRVFPTDYLSWLSTWVP